MFHTSSLSVIEECQKHLKLLSGQTCDCYKSCENFLQKFSASENNVRGFLTSKL